MKKEGILMIFALTFCSAVTAHPGHGTHYPEEVTNDNTTSNPTPTQTTTGTGTSSSTGESSAKKSTAQREEPGQIKNTYEQNKDNRAENQPVEEVTNVNSTANATPSAGSESSPWNTAIIAGLVTAGLAGAGFLFKRGRG